MSVGGGTESGPPPGRRFSPDDLRDLLSELDAQASGPLFPPRAEVQLQAVSAYRLAVFWRITAALYSEAEAQCNTPGVKALCLRFLQLPDAAAPDETAAYWFDVDVHGFSGHRFVDVAEGDRWYRVLLVMKEGREKALPLVRSGTVRTPSGAPPIDARPTTVPDLPARPPDEAPRFEPALDEEALDRMIRDEMRARPTPSIADIGASHSGSAYAASSPAGTEGA